MDSLIRAMKERIEQSAKEDKNESVGQIMNEFISKGYSKDEVMQAFEAVFKMLAGGNEYN